MTNNSSTNEILDKDCLLVKWLCLDLGPFHMLDHTGFRNYIEDENYTLPNVKTLFEETIPKYYDKAKEELKKTLDSVLHVAITIETWKLGVTNRIRGRNMWTATVHFIHQGELISQTLFTIETKVKSGKNISNVLRKILKDEWGILDKVVSFVTNHEKNEHPLSNAVIEYLKIPHLCCIASSLNMDMQEALNYLKFDEIEKRYQKHNSEISRKKKDEPFSWYIPHNVLKEISENETGDFREEERKEIGECVQILKPFVDLTNKMSSEQYLTLSHIIPLTVGVKFQINECSPSTKLGTKFKAKLEAAMDLNFKIDNSENMKIAEKATFMDPRFKKAGFMTEEKANSVQQDVIMELNGSVNSQDQGTSNNLSEEKATAIDGDNLLVYLDERVKYIEGDDKPLHALFTVEQYVDMPYIPRSGNPYQFWDNFKGISKYHTELHNMSQKYLCIPATTIPVESVTGKFLWNKTVPDSINYNKCRNLLDLERIDEVLFLHSYYSRNSE